jgi:hypothetical protein
MGLRKTTAKCLRFGWSGAELGWGDRGRLAGLERKEELDRKVGSVGLEHAGKELGYGK